MRGNRRTLLPWRRVPPTGHPFTSLEGDDEHLGLPPVVNPEPQRSGFFGASRGLLFYKAQMFDQTINLDSDASVRTWLERRILRNASFDASGQIVPSKCQEDTRLYIRQTLVSNLRSPSRGSNFYCLLGPAGVGKTAIMRTIAETMSTDVLGATIFFSRDKDSSRDRILPTLAFQLSSKDKQYFQYIRQLRSQHPSFYEADLKTQFTALFTIPFKKGMFQDRAKPSVILLDGLDECTGAAGEYDLEYETTQRTIIELIHGFVIEHPTASLVWVIAMRPEHRLSTPLRKTSCSVVDIAIDSPDSLEDVQKYIRRSFKQIWEQYPEQFADPTSPNPCDVDKIADAASGFFCFASAAVDFVENPALKMPVKNLLLVLEVIDPPRKAVVMPKNPFAGAESSPESTLEPIHPFSLLHSRYTQIMERIPAARIGFTKRVLACAMAVSSNYPLVRMCKVLQMEIHDVYAALQYLYSVLDVPDYDRAKTANIRYFHSSFRDYLLDPKISHNFYITPQIRADANGSYWWGYFQILQRNITTRTNVSGHESPIVPEAIFDEARRFWVPSLTKIKNLGNNIVQLEGVPNVFIRLRVSDLCDVLQQVVFDRFHMYIPPNSADMTSKLFDSLSGLYQSFREVFQELMEQVTLDVLDIKLIDLKTILGFGGAATPPTYPQRLGQENLSRRERSSEDGLTAVQMRQLSFPRTPVMIWGDKSRTRCVLFKIDYQVSGRSANSVHEGGAVPSSTGIDWEVFFFSYK